MINKNLIVDNLRINYYQGDNYKNFEPLIFLHGWGAEAISLKNVFCDLENYIAIDLPGFGRSEMPKDAWGLNNYSNFLTTFLEKLEIINPILIGHSFGGSIIIKYMGRGGLAKKIILIDSAGIRERGMRVKIYYYIAKIFKLLFLIPGLNFTKDYIRKLFYKAIDSSDYVEAGKLTEIYKKIISEDLSEDLKKIKIKTALIWGEDDKDTLLSDAKKMSELIAGAKLYIIKKAGHFPFLDQPENFNKIFKSQIND